MNRPGDAPAGPGPVRIGVATAGEVPAVLSLLAAAGLPDAGLTDLEGLLLVARADGAVVGSAALEVPPPGDAALLRSVTVCDGGRGRGWGAQLVEAARQHARALGVRRLFLLTEDATGWFRRRGFRECERASVPPSLRATVEFTAACPASAACMVQDLQGDGGHRPPPG